MKFTTTLLANALFATSALAGFAERRERRAAGLASEQAPASRLRSSQPNFRLSNGPTPTEKLELTNNTNVEYSSNWAGAVLTAPPAGSTFTSVSATFTVPTPSGSSGSASAWVGIDGDTYGAAILQTGIDFTISGGQVSYDAWYEWYPDYAYDFSGITLKAGDTIYINVKSSSSSAGVATITNKTTGKTVTKSLTAPSSSSKLGGQNAEWIVEDFESGGSQVAFANFGTVTFSGASAGTSAGQTLTPSGADILDIEQNNKVLTSVSTSGSTVTVKYV